MGHPFKKDKKTMNIKPYIWGIEESYPEKFVLRYHRKSRKTDSMLFMWCIHLPGDTGNSNLSFTLQDPSEYDLIFHVRGEEERLLKYDCLPNNMGGSPPIVNGRVLKVLEEMCPHDFQAFPVEVHNENPKLPNFVNRDYHLLNLVHEIDAIDQRYSTFTDSELLPLIKELVFKENCMEGHHMGRLKGYRSIILVSPELVARFKKEKVKGVRFRTDLEYSLISNPGRHGVKD